MVPPGSGRVWTSFGPWIHDDESVRPSSSQTYWDLAAPRTNLGRSISMVSTDDRLVYRIQCVKDRQGADLVARRKEPV